MNGTIFYYNQDRGFGFLRTSKHKKLFFHETDVDNLAEISEENTPVSVECVRKTRKGLQAFGVHIEKILR